MKVGQVLLLGVATLVSSKGAVLTASHAQASGVSTDIVQPNTYAQQNVGAQRLLRDDTSKDENEERMDFQALEEVSKVVPERFKNTPEEVSNIKPMHLDKSGQGTSESTLDRLRQNPQVFEKFRSLVKSNVRKKQMEKAFNALTVQGGIKKKKVKQSGNSKQLKAMDETSTDLKAMDKTP